MDTCVSCGRELQPGGHADNICPECRARAYIRAQEQAKANRPSLIKVAPVTSAIIAANVLVFAGMVLTGVSVTEPRIQDLVRWGANTGAQTLVNQPWRMWTSN